VGVTHWEREGLHSSSATIRRASPQQCAARNTQQCAACNTQQRAARDAQPCCVRIHPLPFLAAGSDAAPSPELFVVDPCFRDSFQLPNATPEYQALWEALPALFVGTAEQLVPIVKLMCDQVRVVVGSGDDGEHDAWGACATRRRCCVTTLQGQRFRGTHMLLALLQPAAMLPQMQHVFADTASSCPPWRTASCMLTKWLPSAADDVPVVAHGGTRDSDTSTRTSGSNSALSSPRGCTPPGRATTAAAGNSGLFDVPGAVLLAPIRTGGATTADAGGSGATPRSPLYYDAAAVHSKAAAVGLLSPGACGDSGVDRRQLLPAHYPLVGARIAAAAPAGGGAGERDALGVHWPDQDQRVAQLARRRSSDDQHSYFASGAAAGEGSYGYASTCSSPGVEAPMGLLRSCFSEDGGPGGSSGSRRLGVAIVQRHQQHAGWGKGRDSSHGSGGFNDALTARHNAAATHHVATRISLDAGLALAPQGPGSAAAAAAAAAAAFGSSKAPAASRQRRSWHARDRDASLDIARFDSHSSGTGDDALLPPPVWCGLRGSGGSASTSKPPTARLRGSGGSASSALSAAIACQGASMLR
jgi:uncharacterized protein (TIGR01615 family)